eukprot:CAMPEP_0119572318 /NCGR_PEP_ID=MMETSP1352-20130426/44564_1 /TAXON_ID=265584 /ORGANISM="Stauroneis constricta, Strain CCMP1120" /LENGTH=150 /DNA_ID=CAMNT_0007622003 /DNA_START=261 /DNA_END=711 /DNA_ORIENTATION=+
MHEDFAFLYGLRTYGAGDWKQIAKHIPTRIALSIDESTNQSTNQLLSSKKQIAQQIKSHGKVAAARVKAGVNIFKYYDKFRGDADACAAYLNGDPWYDPTLEAKSKLPSRTHADVEAAYTLLHFAKGSVVLQEPSPGRDFVMLMQEQHDT